MGELLSWMAAKTFEVIRKATEALLAIGKTIGNLLQQAVAFGATLVKGLCRRFWRLAKPSRRSLLPF